MIETVEEVFPLLRLPNDLLTDIIKQLDYETINSIRKVSKHFTNLCKRKSIKKTFIQKTSSFRNDNVKSIEKALRDVLVRNLPDGSGLRKVIPRLPLSLYQGDEDEVFYGFENIPDGYPMYDIDSVNFTIFYEYGQVTRRWRTKNQIKKARYRGELYQNWYTPFNGIDGYLPWKIKVLEELKLKFPYLEPSVNQEHDGGFCYIFCRLNVR